ncbi:glucosamine-6-phosphate deaminase [Pedobacter sp.]|uniref:glucosamine-6-phosphate deaminase n=1 Tax=Pedobacter sp. TaxID=1411316 RepID=UPI003D7F20CD
MSTTINNNNIMDVRIFNSRPEMGAAAAKAVSTRLKELQQNQAEINMIFAAAPSQNEFLENLITEDVDWSRINAFHMDEYIGLDESAPQGFGNFLRDRIFSKLPFKSVNYLKDLEYAALLNDFPVDIVCMGIGENGHLAFNDPPVADFKDTEIVKRVELDLACRQQQVNDGCFESLDEVPTHALTLTIPALVKAKHLFVVVPGPAKAQAVYNTLHQAVLEAYPSTILRSHPSAILFLDQDSSTLIA